MSDVAQTDRREIRTRPAILAGIVSMLALVGCATQDGEVSSEPARGTNTPAAEAPAPAPEPEPLPADTPEPAELLVASFGETFEYDDGLSVSISAPTDYEPSEYAAGAEGFDHAATFTVRLVNGTTGR